MLISNKLVVFERMVFAIPCIGILMALVSGMFFATASFTVTRMPNVHPIIIIIARSLVQILVYYPMQIVAKDSIWGKPGERCMLFLRSTIGFLCFVFFYVALRYATLADSSTITFSAPVYVSLFACIFLGEACGIFQTITVVLTISGVFLISKPTFLFGATNEHDAHLSQEVQLIGIILSFLASITMAFTYIVMRKIQKSSTAVVINNGSVVCLVFAIPCMFLFHHALNYPVVVPTSISDYSYLLVNAGCGVFGQFFLTSALKVEEAGLVSLARTFDIVMAFIYQAAFLDEPVVWTSILGAMIVCIGVSLSCLKKLYEVRPDKFNWLFRLTGQVKPVDSDISLRTGGEKGDVKNFRTISLVSNCVSENGMPSIV